MIFNFYPVWCNRDMMKKGTIKKIPLIGKAAVYLKSLIGGEKPFTTSAGYWEERYSKGGSSGAGSYNNLAEFKAEVINSFVSEKNIHSVTDFGCGDGNQLKYFSFKSYLGYDVSDSAISLCKKTYEGDSSKQFKSLRDYQPLKADMTLSLDVIYHLVEDATFYDYMIKLFDTSDRFVIVYSSNSDTHENNGVVYHVKHRKFTEWIEQERPEFKLIRFIPNRYQYNGDGTRSSFADFYIFEKK